MLQIQITSDGAKRLSKELYALPKTADKEYQAKTFFLAQKYQREVFAILGITLTSK